MGENFTINSEFDMSIFWFSTFRIESNQSQTWQFPERSWSEVTVSNFFERALSACFNVIGYLQKNFAIFYYHFRSTLKRDDFFAYVYFLNLTVLSGYVSLSTNETLSVMSRNWQGSWRHLNMFCSRALRLFRFCRMKVFNFLQWRRWEKLTS